MSAFKTKSSQDFFLDANVIRQLQTLNNPGNKDFAVELIEDFLVNVPKKIDALNRHLIAKEMREVFHLAHSIKSSAAAIGAVVIEKTAEQIEKQARNPSSARLNSLQLQLQEEFESTRPFLLNVISQ